LEWDRDWTKYSWVREAPKDDGRMEELEGESRDGVEEAINGWVDML